MSNILELLSSIGAKMLEYKDKHGREAQKYRWELRRRERLLLRKRIRAKRATKRGAVRGAFGSRPAVDPRPALRPAEMRARKQEKVA